MLARRRPPSRRFRVLRLVAVAAALAAACDSRTDTAGARFSPARTAVAAEPTRPDVVVIVVDTLRRDRVGVYRSSTGSPRPTTPAIDRFAGEAALFERAYATAPWTKPSIASIQTGQWPSRHRCRQVTGGLAPEADTLAEMLGRAGYARRGVVSHRLVAGRSQLDQGFESYRSDQARGNRYVSTPGVIDQAIEDLDELARGEQPFLLFVHLFDPHALYQRYPAAGFAPARAGRLSGEEPLDVLRAVAARPDPQEAEFLSALYDEEVRRVDDGVGRLLDRLRTLGRWERTAIVLTADHGEELGQRGWLEHTRTLHDELVAVPLVVKPAGESRTGWRVREPVSLVSLVPTILEWTGAATEAVLDGHSFAGQLRAEATGQGRPAAPARTPLFFEVSYRGFAADPVGSVVRRGVRWGRFKLLEDLESGRLELYDLEQDPRELVDLAQQADHAARRREMQELFAELERAQAGALPEVKDERDEEERKLLQSLGYTGGG